MSADVLVVAEHLRGSLADITFELLAMGRAVAGSLGGACRVALVGGSDDMVAQLGAADEVLRVGGAELADFNPESYLAALRAAVDATGARVVLVGYTSQGMELSSALATATGRNHASFCTTLSGGGSLQAVCRLYGGKLNVTCDLGDAPCVVSVLSGSIAPDEGRKAGAPATRSIDAPAAAGHVRFLRLVEPEAGDVDITTQDVLVAVGRGIGSKDDIGVAEDLAEALGGTVAGSRPIIDAGWLPKTRQVGKSGLKVSPKLYLALGISGAPEHIEGMKSAATIVAINTDAHAPIFNYAHYGMVADLFDVCEELTEAINERG